MRIVHPEDPHAVADPVPHHPQHLPRKSRRVVVEVQRVDVLVLLRRVLRIRDRAVGQLGEPLPVAGGPRMVRCALQCKIQRHLHAEIGGGGDEGVEVGDHAEFGVHGVVAPLRAADRPRRADVTVVGGHGVVGAFAMHGSDRMDRRQIHDVEPHRRYPAKRGGGGSERAVHRPPGCVSAAGGSREQLVPGAAPGEGTIHPHAVGLAPGHQVAQRIGVEQGADRVRECRCGAGHWIARCAQRLGRRQ